MLKIKALNQESSSDEDVPTIRREAQEEIVLELYNNALRAQAQKEYEVSCEMLTKLLEENIPQLENNGGLPKSMSTLKYSCYVNLGKLYLSKNDITKALASFTSASELDSKDVTLWTKIGKLSLKENKFNKAAHAFSKGLECSETHWPCLDNLISVLYAIKDTVSCLVYIGKALMLDSEYTKGIVLRKQIYKENPATRDYYQLFNPEHIWEPPVDVEVDPDDEEAILKEAELLSSRVTETERSFQFKPVETIPLPRGLEEYTWFSLAKTIAFCHQYITDNNMSHFISFDMNKCMSQSGDCMKSNISEEVPIIQETKESSVSKSGDSPNELSNPTEKMDIESSTAIERRFSQNSENTGGNDKEDNTPSQTDNDEEQNMEIDNDNETDGDNQAYNADAAQSKKKGKRKRDVLSDLQIWGWHSKRKPPKKPTRDFTVEDALNRILPKTLLKAKLHNNIFNQTVEEGSMDTMDIYNMYVENKELNFLSPLHSPESVNFDCYFGSDREKDDVLRFWTQSRVRVDAAVLVKELVFELSKLWNYKWPKELIRLYIELFKMFREHYDQPQPFCSNETFEQIRDDALASLLFGEFIMFSSEINESVHPSIMSYLQIVSSWNDEWKDEYSLFFIRFYWLQAHCFRKSDENELAIRAFEAILSEIDVKEKDTSERFSLNLWNLVKYGVVSRQIIEKIISHLNMITSLGTVETLFNAQKYGEVADILKRTFHCGSYPKIGKMGRPAQLGILMHSLWFFDWEECFIWTEECLNEAVSIYSKSGGELDKWEMIIEKCLGIFQEVIKKETVSVIDKLSEEKRCRLVENLAKIVCKQLNTEGVTSIPLGSITAWILLHYILLREEQRQYANKRLSQAKRDKEDGGAKEKSPEPLDEELPSSIAILFSAHEFLGPKGWCLTGDGELLHFILDTILERLDTPIFEPFREKIDIHIEQALFCLYLYPSKKNKISRHLVDHNVNPIPLTWERSFQLYQYYAPEILPEFNSYKSQSISSDLEQLFKRIICLVPSVCPLESHLCKIVDYIHGKVAVTPESIDFPGKIRAIYYLLGDYYFKEKEFERCIKYFQLDLCINPMRLDSWASLGLSYAAQLENLLNYCEKLKNETDFFEKAKAAQTCFRKALALDPENLVLWIECGSFEYMVHSFCSRLIKYESENFSMDKFKFFETEKDSYLDSSGKSLEHAIRLHEINVNNEPDERWLQYYILGKIAEKKRKEPSEYLQFYMTASALLNENNATYPEKINYNNPQHLSVEALELHYRIHASILKFLELHEGKGMTNTQGNFFKKCLNTTAKRFVAISPQQVTKAPEPTKDIPVPNGTSFQDQFLNSLRDSDSEDAEIIVKMCLEDLLDKVDELVNKNKELAQEIKDNKNGIVEDMDVSIVENEQVIMIISDSEDEACDAKKDEPSKAEVQTSGFQKEADADIDVVHVKNQVLQESTPQGGLDKQIELVAKDDTSQPKEPTKPQSPSKAIGTSPKNKPSDSETDTDNKKTTADEDSSSSSSSSSGDSSSSDSDSEDSDSSSSSQTSDSTTENMSHNEIAQLVDKCVHGLEVCIKRLPQNYKAIYRLAHLFFNYKGRKDFTKCKQLLLGQYNCKDDTSIHGLFSERNTKNFFNGIWRIPSTEIDRPGSLAAHMNRCITLMLQVLRNTNDTKTLMELSMQLRKTPDRDKIYIKDSERMAFSKQAMDMCIQIFKAQIKNIPDMQNQQTLKLLHDIFRAYQKIQKYASNKEAIFAGLLTSAYKSYIKEPIPASINVLEVAIKFCQQHRPTTEKPKVTPNVGVIPSLAASSRSPGVGNPPVHPAPSTFTQPPQKVLKSPSVGRPRGRPPLPKVPGQTRQSRGKSPSAYPWQNPMYAAANFNYEYLKHYQDELIKQYSQNLNLTQLKQLNGMFGGTASQLSSNPAVAQAMTNQFLSQASLLNPVFRAPPSSVAPSMTTPSFFDLQKAYSSQLMTPSVLSSFTPEQMKILESMLPKTTAKTSSTMSKAGPSSGKSAKSANVPSFKPYQMDFKPKTSTITKLPDALFKEPKPTASKIQTGGDGATSLLIKDRPNISITPVTSLMHTSAVTSSTGISKLGHQSNVATANVASFSKQLSLPSTSSMSFSHSKTTKTSTVTSSKSNKSNYAPTVVSSVAFSKPPQLQHAGAVPMAHSSVGGPKPAHSSPLTPPPVSSPSFMKPVMPSASPTKTLQEKLADKKKEQETKHMMKNIEAEIFASKMPSGGGSLQSNALLKGLNISNIPSSLSVTPSTPINPVNPYSISPGTDKAGSFQRFGGTSKNSNTGHVSHTTMEHKLPSALTVSKTVPSFTPRFPPDSGISISQIAKTKSTKQSQSVPVAERPITSKKTLPTLSKPSASSVISASVNVKAKSAINVKTDLFPRKKSAKGGSSTVLKPAIKKSSLLSLPNKQTNVPSHKEPTTGKYIDKGSHSQSETSQKRALSVIKKLASIDITPVTKPAKSNNNGDDDDDVICLD